MTTRKQDPFRARPKTKAEAKPVPAPEPEEPSAPSGTTKEVLEWVGDDPVKAQLALDTELESDRPRVKLIEAVSGIIADE